MGREGDFLPLQLANAKCGIRKKKIVVRIVCLQLELKVCLHLYAHVPHSLLIPLTF